MAFPQSPLGIKVQINLQGLGWTDIVRDAVNGYRILAEDGIDITRGHTAEQSRTSQSTLNCTIFDPNGVFNNANPRSPYYGILPRNTPIRCYVQRPTVAFYSPLDATGSFRTPSSAGINAAGDVDVVVDFEIPHFRGSFPGAMLASKWNTAGQRSWALRVNGDGFLGYSFSQDGTSFSTVFSTVPITSITAGRIAVRVFHDVVDTVNNTIYFQTAPTVFGSFTNLGSSLTFGGNVSIFVSTSTLEIGSGNNGSGTFTNTNTIVGRIYWFQLSRNAVQVAKIDFTSRSVGTTTHTDPSGNLWTLTAGASGLRAEVTNADYRFHGEIASLPQTWDTSGRAVRVALEAGGVLRRLSANATPVRSPIYRNFVNQAPTGYWTGEDGSTATVAGSSVTGSAAASIADITFGTDAGLAGSGGVMILGGTGPLFIGNAKPTASSSTTQASLVAYFKFPSIPLSNLTLFSLSVSGGAATRVDFVVETTSYRVNAYDNTGTLLATNATLYGAGAEPNNWVGVNVRVSPSGANTNLAVDWHSVGTTTFYTMGSVSYAGVPGRFSRLTVQGIAALSGVKLAHLLLTQFNFTFVSPSFATYSRGYAGETAAARWVRVLTDAGISGAIIGRPETTELMGPQPVDTVPNILYECADVDGGEIVEPRDRLGLDYRTRASMYDGYGLGLNYGTGGSIKQLSGELRPVPDDLNVSNDITLNRKNGSSIQVTLDTGPMSTLDPTLGGIGRAPSTPEINNYLDSRLLVLAQYLLGLSTWPEARYPTVQIDLHRISAFSFYDSTFTLAASTDVGDTFGITNLPAHLAPDALVLIARGMRETLTQFTWNVTYNASPGLPYRTNFLSTTATEQKRADASNTVLNAAITNTATSASFKTTSGALCVTTAVNPAEFPFDVMIGGERVTVTAIVGTSSPQAATITRSVNGIIKAQVINAPITLPSDTATVVAL